MPTEIKLPDLGEGIEGGDVLKILVSEGDTIQEEQSVLEIETDKATIEVPSPTSGKVVKIAVTEGERAEVGSVILHVEESEGGSAPEPAPGEAPQKAAEKPAAERPASAPAAAAPASAAPAPAPVTARAPGSPIPAAPIVRKLARELGVNLDGLSGSGPRGRILTTDVTAAAKRTGGGGGALPVGEPLPDFTRWGEVEVQKMSGIRRVTAHHLSSAWATIPHVTQHDKADVTALEEFRTGHTKIADRRGVKLTVTAILAKVCARALEVFPDFNTSVDLANETILYKKFVNIGIAVDTPNGLLVPVIRDANQKSILELAGEIGDLAQRARDRKVSPDDLKGGCFTITNLGGIGGVGFTPVVNAPEVAILGVSRTQTEPVWDGEGFEARQMLPLSLSYDHRVIDGAAAARFTRWIARALEQPMSMFLGDEA